MHEHLHVDFMLNKIACKNCFFFFSKINFKWFGTTLRADSYWYNVQVSNTPEANESPWIALVRNDPVPMGPSWMWSHSIWMAGFRHDVSIAKCHSSPVQMVKSYSARDQPRLESVYVVHRAVYARLPWNLPYVLHRNRRCVASVFAKKNRMW